MNNFSNTLDIAVSIATKAEQDRIIKIIDDTADFYHQMIADKGDYWTKAYMTALDLLERIQGLEENSLANAHDLTCDCIK
jgi:hypothetical protein